MPSRHQPCRSQRHRHHHRRHHHHHHHDCTLLPVPVPAAAVPVYGEFIRTFTFSANLQRPIVQPGGSVTFPTVTVPPRGVTYVDTPAQTGLLVPQGVYLLALTLSLDVGATVSVLVNGIVPTAAADGFQYGTTVVDSPPPVERQFLINAPLVENNLIALVNTGDTLFTVNDIPNTRIGNTVMITQIRVTRVQ